MLGNKSREIFSVEPTISGIKSSLKKKTTYTDDRTKERDKS